MNPRPLLRVVTDHAEAPARDLPVTVDPTEHGATLALAPVTAVDLALALIHQGTPSQFARMSAAACSTDPDITSRGVTELARLLAAHARVDLDRGEVDALVDQLDDAACIVPAPADPVEAAGWDAADTHLDLLKGK